MSAIILSIGKVRVQGPDSVRCRHSNGTREEALEKGTILMAWRLEGWSLRRERHTNTHTHTHTQTHKERAAWKSRDRCNLCCWHQLLFSIPPDLRTSKEREVRGSQERRLYFHERTTTVLQPRSPLCCMMDSGFSKFGVLVFFINHRICASSHEIFQLRGAATTKRLAAAICFTSNSSI